jgi:dolichyl-phosphate beta-glucosyltransferase
MHPYLSIIIPCYNEEKRIGRNLLLIENYLQAQKIPSEILVIVDGATDDTLKVATDYKKKINNL